MTTGICLTSKQLKKNRSGFLQDKDLDEKISELDSMFKTQSLSNLNQMMEKSVVNGLKNYQQISQSNLKEQILAKCIKTNTIKLTETVNNSTNNLHKCKSIEALQITAKGGPSIDRPRSITIE